MSAEEHKAHAPRRARCAALTVTDSRDLSQDASGALLVELLTGAGHEVAARELLPNDRAGIEAALRALVARDDVDVVIATGGTGIGPKDLTADAVLALVERELPGFGELFRYLSYAEIGAAAMLSRAAGGVAGGKLLFALPGSSKAVRLALEKLLLPELGHMLGELSGRRKR
jgi:molybdopterin adenylyltransferase